MQRFRLVIDGTTKQPNRFNLRLFAVFVAILLVLFEQWIAAVVYLSFTLLLIDIRHELQLLGRRRQIDGFEVNETR